MARRPETISSRRPVRAPASEAPAAYRAHTSPRNSAAAPTPAVNSGVLRELRRALRDQGVPLADERSAAKRAGNDHLAAVAEGVRHRAHVRDWQRRAAVAVADP